MREKQLTSYDYAHAKSHGLTADIAKAAQYARKFEGLRLKPYKCPAGKLTIGYGHNLEDNGITKEVAEKLLKSDLQYADIECLSHIPSYARIDEARKFVLLDMCFNMGISRLLTFKKMLAALQEGYYERAAYEMLNSKWAKQVGRRAKELAEIMKTGVY